MLRCVLVFLALCCARGAVAQNLLLQLTPQPVSAGALSTRAEPIGVLAMPGEPVRFGRAEGRDTRLRAGSGLGWTQVEEVPRNVESLSLLPTVLDDGRIRVQVERLLRHETRLRQFSSTVLVQPGEWLQLYGPAPGGMQGGRVYGTDTAAGDSLYLRIEIR